MNSLGYKELGPVIWKCFTDVMEMKWSRRRWPRRHTSISSNVEADIFMARIWVRIKNHLEAKSFSKIKYGASFLREILK